MNRWREAADAGYARGITWAKIQIEVCARDCGLPLNSPAADVLRELGRRLQVRLDSLKSGEIMPGTSVRSRAFAIPCPLCGAAPGIACVGLHNGLHKQRKDATKGTDVEK